MTTPPETTGRKIPAGVCGWRVADRVRPGGCNAAFAAPRGDGPGAAPRRVRVVRRGDRALRRRCRHLVVGGREHGSPRPWRGRDRADRRDARVVSERRRAPARLQQRCSSSPAASALASSRESRSPRYPRCSRFVFAFTNGPAWLYYLGAAITLVRMAMAAPTPTATSSATRTSSTRRAASARW